jgi:hypothetical protein
MDRVFDTLDKIEEKLDKLFEVKSWRIKRKKDKEN